MVIFGSLCVPVVKHLRHVLVDDNIAIASARVVADTAAEGFGDRFHRLRRRDESVRSIRDRLRRRRREVRDVGAKLRLRW